LGIAALHLAVIWALLQAPAARHRPPAAEPVVVRLWALAAAPAAPAAAPAAPVPPRSEAVAATPLPLPLPVPVPSPARELATMATVPARAVRPPSPQAESTPLSLSASASAAAALVDLHTPAPAAMADEPAAPAAKPAPPVLAAASQPSAPKQIPASAVQYLDRVLPIYSPASVRAREAGRVLARVWIDEAGLPRTVQLQQGSRFVRLDEACTAAVRQSRFKPYAENGQPTAGWALVPCDFEL